MDEKEIKNKKQERIQITFLILLTLAIVCLLIAVVVIVKNVNMFKVNPIAFGIDKYGFDNCLCQQGGTFVNVDETGFRNQLHETNVNLEGFNFGAERSDGYFGEE